MKPDQHQTINWPQLQNLVNQPLDWLYGFAHVQPNWKLRQIKLGIDHEIYEPIKTAVTERPTPHTC